MRESANTSTFSSFTVLVLGFYLIFIDAPVQVSNILFLTVCCNFIHSSFQISLLFFVPEMSASFTSYIVQIIYITLFWIPTTASFDLKIVNILHQTMDCKLLIGLILRIDTIVFILHQNTINFTYNGGFSPDEIRRISFSPM
jgi:hypothetical protein